MFEVKFGIRSDILLGKGQNSSNFIFNISKLANESSIYSLIKIQLWLEDFHKYYSINSSDTI